MTGYVVAGGCPFVVRNGVVAEAARIIIDELILDQSMPHVAEH